MSFKLAALKMIKSFITPEQIKEITADILAKAIDEKNKINLDPLNDEADAAAIFYEVKGVPYFSIAILSTENNIVRFEGTRELSGLIDSLIQNL